jgi:hypothetical protein
MRRQVKNPECRQMELASFIIAVVGIALTIILSDPAIRLIRLAIFSVRKRIWSAQQYREGLLRNRRHFGYEDWTVKILVDRFGSTKQEFDARIINLSNEFLRTLYIPFFSDATNTSRYELEPWARSGRRRLPVSFDFMDERRSQGRIEISHEPPLKPGERRRVHWGFELPRLFSPGDDYYIWDVEVPHYDMRGSISFSSEWKILYAKWDNSNSEHPPTLTYTESELSWQTTLPQPGKRLYLRLGLQRNQL